MLVLDGRGRPLAAVVVTAAAARRAWPADGRRRGGHELVAPLPTDDGPAAWDATGALGLEGDVAKRKDSPYAGGWQAWWVKCEHPPARDLQPRAFAKPARKD